MILYMIIPVTIIKLQVLYLHVVLLLPEIVKGMNVGMVTQVLLVLENNVDFSPMMRMMYIKLIHCKNCSRIP